MKVFDMNVCKTLKTNLLYFSYEGDRKGFWQFFALRKFCFHCLIVHLIINFTFFPCMPSTMPLYPSSITNTICMVSQYSQFETHPQPYTSLECFLKHTIELQWCFKYQLRQLKIKVRGPNYLPASFMEHLDFHLTEIH